MLLMIFVASDGGFKNQNALNQRHFIQILFLARFFSVCVNNAVNIDVNTSVPLEESANPSEMEIFQA